MKYNLKYSKEILENAVTDSKSISEVIRKLGLKHAGGTHSHISRRVKHFNINTSHFSNAGTANSGTNFGGGCAKLNPEEVLVFDRNSGRRENVNRLRHALLASGIDHKCQICGLPPEWNGKPLQLHIDHIDGECINNVKENLRFLCLHCHSQTETYCRKKSKIE